MSEVVHKDLDETRTETNERLEDERVVADHSIASAEDRADVVVEGHRDDTDEKLRCEREKADHELQEHPEQLAAEVADDPSRINDLLAEERARADAGLELEREKIDEALEHERDERRRIEQEHLEQRRHTTDEGLAHERDETDRAVEEVALRLSEEREAHTATRATVVTRDQILAIVSHDLRNPLGAIATAASLIMVTASDDASGQRARRLGEQIRRLSGQMEHIIGDLLDLEAIAAGKLRVKLVRHDVSEIARDATELSRTAAAAKGLSLHVSVPPVPTFAQVDRGRILQVFGNLLGNALKFAPQGSTIDVGVTKHAGKIRVEVRDRGPGIPQDQLSSIFEQFSQLEKDDRRGLGLGLFIARWIVEEHRGRIWVESRVGQGSTFVFTLPADEGTEGVADR